MSAGGGAPNRAVIVAPSFARCSRLGPPLSTPHPQNRRVVSTAGTINRLTRAERHENVLIVLENTNTDRKSPPTAAPDRRARRREATKTEILDAAWAIVREEGLAVLSLRDVAARVGMRAPSLYQYFASKHAIYDAMFGQAARQALDAVAGPLENTDPRAAFRTSARRIFEFATSDPARAQLLFQRTIPGFEPSPESYAPAVALLDWSRDRIAAVGITDPHALDMWTALISGLMSQQIANDPGGARWAVLIDDAVDMFLAKFSPDRPRT